MFTVTVSTSINYCSNMHVATFCHHNNKHGRVRVCVTGGHRK